MRIEKLLTDNGSQFIDRFTTQGKKPSGDHVFDRQCAKLDIEHRLIKPRHPQTNGLVERFNGRISDVLATTHFRSREDLQTTIERYVKLYNEHLPQRALKHQTPLQALHSWRTQRPELFVRKPKNQAGLDTYTGRLVPASLVMYSWPVFTGNGESATKGNSALGWDFLVCFVLE